MDRVTPLACAVVGPAQAPPLLLLHGWLADRRDWHGVVDRLGERFRCIVMDLPGHGASPGADPDGLGAAAAAVWATLDHLGVERTAVAGYSMGGRLALHVALAQPQRCAALAVLGASPGLIGATDRAARAALDDALARDLDGSELREFISRWYRLPLFSGLAAALTAAEFEALLDRRAEAQPARLAAALRYLSVGRQASLWPQLPKLTMPLLWLAGAVDAHYHAVAQAASTASPDARFAALAGCSHALLLEDPAGVARELAGFLDAT